MVTINPINENETEELIITRDLSIGEFNVITKALKQFLLSFTPFNLKKEIHRSVRSQKRQAKHLITDLGEFSKNLAITTGELEVIKTALTDFASQPDPLMSPIERIHRIQNQKVLALDLLKDMTDLEEVF